MLKTQVKYLSFIVAYVIMQISGEVNIFMKVETGYLYHIKDEYFDVVKDEGLMKNHERGKMRPTYFTIKDGNILWFIPLSTKVDKYKKIIKEKIRKYHKCNSIIIGTIAESETAILIQNAFPTLEKYISHYHIKNKAPVRVPDDLKNEIVDNFNTLLALKSQGTNLFFSNIDKLKQMMLDELKEDLN